MLLQKYTELLQFQGGSGNKCKAVLKGRGFKPIFLMMSPETAMRQAKETAHWYFEYGAKVIDEIYPEATQDSKAVAASNFAIAAALDYLAAVAGGNVEGTQRTTQPPTG